MSLTLIISLLLRMDFKILTKTNTSAYIFSIWNYGIRAVFKVWGQENKSLWGSGYTLPSHFWKLCACLTSSVQGHPNHQVPEACILSAGQFVFQLPLCPPPRSSPWSSEWPISHGIRWKHIEGREKTTTWSVKKSQHSCRVQNPSLDTWENSCPLASISSHVNWAEQPS